MHRLNISHKQFYITLNEIRLYECDPNAPVHAANLVRIGIDGTSSNTNHDDVIKWKHFPRYWPFVRGIHRSPVNSPHKGQWRGALMFSLICAWINGWVHNRKAGDMRRYRAHYDVTVMYLESTRCNRSPYCNRNSFDLSVIKGNTVTDGIKSLKHGKWDGSEGMCWNHLSLSTEIFDKQIALLFTAMLRHGDNQ